MDMLEIVIVFIVALLKDVYSMKHCNLTTSNMDIIYDCSNHGYRVVPTHIPHNVTILDLSGNRLTLLCNNTFMSLVNLHTLYLALSRVTHIDVNAFYGLQRLRNLNLESNYLDVKSLKLGVFERIPNLVSMDLSHNLFHISNGYPDKVLSVLSKLQSLTINGMDNVSFGGGFESLLSLNSLILSPCNIQRLTNGTFPAFTKIPIQQLTLECTIKQVEVGALEPLKSVKTLRIINNIYIRVSDLVNILGVYKDKNMTLIGFSNNYRIKTGPDVLTPEHFSILGQICVKEIDISNNQISIIRFGSISRIKYKHCLEVLNMAHNIIYGDLGSALELYKLTNLKVIDISWQNPIGEIYGTSNSSSKDSLEISNISKHIQILRSTSSMSRILSTTVTNASHGPMSTTLKANVNTVTYVFPLPPNIQYIYAQRISMKSTDLANVNFTFGRHLKLFDLDWTSFRNCNGKFNGIDNIEIFRMSGFNCADINLNMMQSFKQLRSLESKAANLGLGLEKDVSGQFLEGLILLENIDFSGNMFSSLHENLFRSQYHALVTLSLSDNKLTDFPFNISKFSKLVYIDVSNNRIRYLQPGTTKELDAANTKLSSKLNLRLSGNIFECNCMSMQFIQWTQQTHISLDNKGNYSCVYIDGSTKSTVYAYQHMNMLKSNCMSNFWLVFSLSLSGLFIIIIVGGFIGFKYRITLQYWYLNIRRKYRHYSSLDGDSKEYKYSAFVAYHNSDYKWVCGPLCSYLEKERNHVLCLHHRDFIPGSFIADNICEAISQSRKIILVISKQFLESYWCEFELEMARMQMFHESRDMLIVIFLQNISKHEMPKSLLRVWDKVTCLEIKDTTDISNLNANEDSLFWKRLFEALLM